MDQERTNLPLRAQTARTQAVPLSLLGLSFEAAPNGLLVIDAHATVVAANAALLRMFGYELPDLIGHPLELLVPARQRREHIALRTAFVESPQRRAMGSGRELHAQHASGREFPVEIGLNPMNTPQGQLVLASVIDISARRRVEMELRQANENLREFTYVASHDLKSPLRGIADLVGWVREDLGDAPPQRVARNLDRIGDRVERLDRLITDLLHYARAEAVDNECTAIDIAEVIRDIVQMDPLPDGFELELDIPPMALMAPRTPVATVLRNLLGNAVKHHDRGGGALRVAARTESGFCHISLRDDGPGIPAAAQQRVFRLFQTAGTAQRAGSGLGLALSKRIAEVHGGRIELQSPVCGGRGACFTLWWPAIPQRAQ